MEKLQISDPIPQGLIPLDRLNNKDWKEVLNQVKHQIETDGYCVIQAKSTERSVLLELTEYFGKRQRHKYSDEWGMNEISTFVDNTLADNTDAPIGQYLGSTAEEFPLHTDGAYLQGIVKTKDCRLLQINPPKLLFLHMMEMAEEGGASVLLDSQQVLEDALDSDLDLVKVLLKPCVVYSRDDQLAFSSVFERISAETWRIRWRYDFTTLVEESAGDAIKLFHSKYISNPKYQKRFYLQPGEILVADNFRVLHGRDAFKNRPEKPRLLYLAWIADTEKVFINPLDQLKHQRVYDQYEPYSYVEIENKKSAISIFTGIRLSPDKQAIAKQLLSESS